MIQTVLFIIKECIIYFISIFLTHLNGEQCIGDMQ